MMAPFFSTGLPLFPISSPLPYLIVHWISKEVIILQHWDKVPRKSERCGFTRVSPFPPYYKAYGLAWFGKVGAASSLPFLSWPAQITT